MPQIRQSAVKTLLHPHFPHTFHRASQIPLPRLHPDQDTHLDTSKTSPTKGNKKLQITHQRKNHNTLETLKGKKEDGFAGTSGNFLCK